MDIAADRSLATTLSGTRAVWAITACFTIMFAGSTLPTPLYPDYQRLFGFSELTLTLIYAAYVVGNLGALLLLGRLSDQIGRRPVALAAIGIAFVSAVAFAMARGVMWLAAARILSGLALGLTSGTCAAWLTEHMPPGRKPLAASFAIGGNMLGLALGALFAGLLAQYAPWPLRLAYIVYLVVLMGLAVLVLLCRETLRHRVRLSRELSLRPRLGVPASLRLQFFAPAVTTFGSMALFGFYAALAPGMLGRMLHRASPAAAGAVVFELCAVAAVTVGATRSLSSRKAMLSGLAGQIPALGLLVWAQKTQSLTLLLVGTTLTGIACALGYRGGLQVVNRIAPDEQRAEVVSSYFVATFAGNSLPIIGVGSLTSVLGSMAATLVFAVTIGLFAAAALIIGARYAPAPAPEPEPGPRPEPE